MKLSDLERIDRRIAVGAACFSVFVLSGLTISGLWHFVVYNPTVDDLVLAGNRPELTNRPDTATEIHGAFVDIGAAFAFLVVAWLSYRVLARVSRTGVAALLVITATILGGGALNIHEVVLRPGERAAVRGDTTFTQYNIDTVPDPLRTVAHVVSIPVLIFLVWFAFYRSRHAATADTQPSWLDHFSPNEQP